MDTQRSIGLRSHPLIMSTAGGMSPPTHQDDSKHHVRINGGQRMVKSKVYNKSSFISYATHGKIFSIKLYLILFLVYLNDNNFFNVQTRQGIVESINSHGRQWIDRDNKDNGRANKTVCNSRDIHMANYFRRVHIYLIKKKIKYINGTATHSGHRRNRRCITLRYIE